MSSQPSPNTQAYLVNLIFKYGGLAVAKACLEIAKSKLAQAILTKSKPDQALLNSWYEMNEKSDLLAQFWWEVRNVSQTENLEPTAPHDKNNHADEQNPCLEEEKNFIEKYDSIICRMNNLSGKINIEGRKDFLPQAPRRKHCIEENDGFDGLESRIEYLQNKLPKQLADDIDFFHKQSDFHEQFIKTGCRLNFLQELDKLIQ